MCVCVCVCELVRETRDGGHTCTLHAPGALDFALWNAVKVGPEAKRTADEDGGARVQDAEDREREVDENVPALRVAANRFDDVVRFVELREARGGDVDAAPRGQILLPRHSIYLAEGILLRQQQIGASPKHEEGAHCQRQSDAKEQHDDEAARVRRARPLLVLLTRDPLLLRIEYYTSSALSRVRRDDGHLKEQRKKSVRVSVLRVCAACMCTSSCRRRA